MVVSFSEIFLCFLINLNWFLIAFLVIYELYNDCRQHDGKSFVDNDGVQLICILTLIVVIILSIVSLAIIISCIANDSLTIQNVSLFFIIAAVFFIIFKLMKRSIKKSPWNIYSCRREKIVEKYKYIQDDLEYYEKKLNNIHASKREKEAYNNYISALKDMKEELNLILVSLDISFTVETVKDVELQPNTLELLEKEVDKARAYHSLEEISSNMNELMKKYD